MARKNLIKATEDLLLNLHGRVEQSDMDLASQLKLVAASTAFLAAKAKLVSDDPPESGLSALLGEMRDGDKPKRGNGKVVPIKPDPSDTFANY